MSVLLEVENLEKRFNGRTVVDRVSFSLPPGFFWVLGAF